MPSTFRRTAFYLAERVGFEPTVPLLVHELSKLARSATLTPLQLLDLVVIFHLYQFQTRSFGHSPRESFRLTPLQLLGLVIYC